ncbi:MAG: hypothetical protein L6R37_006359 [Teloschistes peruensis]|nr:MAG: hypothetical protein L6R37_006359 [Teloschistes peruensis]
MPNSPTLPSKLAASLPSPHKFTIHHLSTPPTPSPAIYSAPPAQVPEKTKCESHFLSVSAPHNGSQVQLFALEVLIYTTTTLITIFVSKADSTGYIHLLKLPKGTPSPLRTISSIFLSHLVESHQRKDRQLVVSLFARAQDQYLFPGSIENSGKHVLDDRGLVKWWCRVLEPVLQPSSHDEKNTTSTVKAYLRVPGCDLHEHLSFFPPHVRSSPTLRAQWHPSRDPLLLLNRPPNAPERCLIPRFPDDPKSRFVDELDEELTEPPPDPKKHKESPSKGKRPGKWRSVRSLEEFWEMMAFRQECSSGRLVGFLWAVFTPEGLATSSAPPKLDFAQKPSLPPPSTTATEKSQQPLASSSPPTSSSSSTKDPTVVQSNSETAFLDRHGGVTLPQKHYTRCISLLLHLDYATLAIAAESSMRWIEDVGICAGREGWGWDVVGQMKGAGLLGLEGAMGGGEVGGRKEGMGEVGTGVEAGGANVLDAGLVRKKKRAGDGEGDAGSAIGAEGRAMDGDTVVNVLSTGLVRKKPKIK